MIALTIYGTPIPKGSTRAFFRPGMKHAVITHDNARTRPWQEAIVAAALDVVAGKEPIEEPVALFVRFFLPRPKSAPRRITEPAKKPDLDKLVRCLKDGLTRAGVYRDDAQVVRLEAMKDFAGGVCDPAGPNGLPRAVVEVATLAEARASGLWPGETITLTLPRETKARR